MQVLTAPNGRIAKIWVRDLSEVESASLDQIRTMLQFPALAGHIAVMPDVHLGRGAVVGGVVATEQVVVPNIVGVDIGCGMSAWRTGVQYDRERMNREFWRKWKGVVDRAVPTGFSRHSESRDLGALADRNLRAKSLLNFQRDVAPLQLGTLGGGNHFMEAQFDETDIIWLMVHSGSRHTGLQIATYYDKLAKALNQKWHAGTPDQLWFLPIDSQEGADYWHDMQWATDFALENRYRMLEVMANAFMAAVDLPYEAELVRQNGINIHHNFAAKEHHAGKDVVVHRKGATQARAGQLGIIPGSMGAVSYIVRGLGTPESYESCSHGAGRTMSRKKAKQTISQQELVAALDSTYTSPSAHLLDEAPQAYKNIDDVMSEQADLVSIVHTLHPIITLKGEGNDN